MKGFGFAGYSGAGKTTLIKRVIPRLVLHRLKVSLLKHARHSFDIDKPGKDSCRHREAGCSKVLITSHRRWGTSAFPIDESLAANQWSVHCESRS